MPAGRSSNRALDANVDQVTAARALRTALDPHGEWVPNVLAAADARLTQVRAGGTGDAAGLVLATNQAHARAYAKQLEALTGERPTVVLSDGADGSRKIEEFSGSTRRWIVAVRMVSEGVDIPRISCLVWANTTTTALFFAQAVGRAVRARRAGETTTVFLPASPKLLRLAAELETERDHALDRPAKNDDGGFDDAALAAANRTERTVDPDAGVFTALEATAHLDRVIYNGAEFGTAAETGSDTERHLLAMPGLLGMDEVRRLLEEQARR